MALWPCFIRRASGSVELARATPRRPAPAVLPLFAPPAAGALAPVPGSPFRPKALPNVRNGVPLFVPQCDAAKPHWGLVNELRDEPG